MNWDEVQDLIITSWYCEGRVNKRKLKYRNLKGNICENNPSKVAHGHQNNNTIQENRNNGNQNNQHGVQQSTDNGGFKKKCKLFCVHEFKDWH